MTEFVRDCYGSFCDVVDIYSDYADSRWREIQQRKRTLALMATLKEELDKREHVAR